MDVSDIFLLRGGEVESEAPGGLRRYGLSILKTRKI